MWFYPFQSIPAMTKRVWEADAAAGRCWVVYEAVSPNFRQSHIDDERDGFFVRKAVLTVWDTNPPQLTGQPKYTRNDAIRALLDVTSELNGGTLPEAVMDAVVTTMELVG